MLVQVTFSRSKEVTFQWHMQLDMLTTVQKDRLWLLMENGYFIGLAQRDCSIPSNSNSVPIGAGHCMHSECMHNTCTEGPEYSVKTVIYMGICTVLP